MWTLFTLFTEHQSRDGNRETANQFPITRHRYVLQVGGEEDRQATEHEDGDVGHSLFSNA